MGNIVNVDVKGASAFRVVMAPTDGDYRGDLVLDFSNQGWRVVQVFERTTQELLFTRDEFGSKRANGERQNVIQIGFLMAYFPDDPVADLQKQLAEANAAARQRATEALVAKDELKRLAETAEAKKKDLESRLARSEASLETSRRDVEAYTRTKQRFEQDIGKLRKALGDMRMKEILDT